MCNNIHDDHFIDIAEKGIGYKMFIARKEKDKDTLFEDCVLRSIINGRYFMVRLGTTLHTSREANPEKEWIKWWDSISATNYDGGVGFCFFRNLEDAFRIARMFWLPAGDLMVICKIVYRGGLGEFYEDGINGLRERSSLCKEFRVVARISYIHDNVGFLGEDINSGEKPTRDDWSGHEFLYEKEVS